MDSEKVSMREKKNESIGSIGKSEAVSKTHSYPSAISVFRLLFVLKYHILVTSVFPLMVAGRYLTTFSKFPSILILFIFFMLNITCTYIAKINRNRTDGEGQECQLIFCTWLRKWNGEKNANEIIFHFENKCAVIE